MFRLASFNSVRKCFAVVKQQKTQQRPSQQAVEDEIICPLGSRGRRSRQSVAEGYFRPYLEALVQEIRRIPGILFFFFFSVSYGRLRRTSRFRRGEDAAVIPSRNGCPEGGEGEGEGDSQVPFFFFFFFSSAARTGDCAGLQDSGGVKTPQ